MNKGLLLFVFVLLLEGLTALSGLFFGLWCLYTAWKVCYGKEDE